MNEILIKLGIMVICAGLKLISELWWHNAQRYILPIVLGVAISYFSHVWWLGLTALIMIADLVQGYGPKSWMYKYLDDAGARGMWLFLAAALSTLGCVIFNHLGWYFYVPHILIAGVIGATLRNFNNKIIAPIVGAYLASILFFVH